MKRVIRTALVDTIPVMTGYLALGFGFGIVLKAAGYGIPYALLMSVTVFAGAMQYVAVGLLAGGASFVTVALTTLMVNIRHLFYGISLLDKYKGTGWKKPYLAFGLTDETYSLVCHDNATVPPEDKHRYYFFVTLFDHLYWITGCVLGSLAGTLVKFNSEGIDFVLTALFITIFLGQWRENKQHASALIGMVASAVCLLLFGGDSFLLPAMIVIAVALCPIREGGKHE